MADQQPPKVNVWQKIADLVVAFLQAIFGKINKLETENDRKQLELDKRSSHDKIDADAAQRGADSLLDDAIREGGGDPTKSGASSTGGGDVPPGQSGK